MGHNLLLYTLPNHQNISTAVRSSPKGEMETALRAGAI